MNQILTRVIRSNQAATATAAIMLLSVFTSASLAQTQSKPNNTAATAKAPQTAASQQATTSLYAEPETTGSVTQPQGDDYVLPQKLNPKLARLTLYRPIQGFTPGVAHLEINGHYHTSLQLGGYSEICVEPADFTLAAHMVQTGGELKNYQDATATLKPQAAQNMFVRVFEYGDGRATLTPVKADIALVELKDTPRRISSV